MIIRYRNGQAIPKACDEIYARIRCCIAHKSAGRGPALKIMQMEYLKMRRSHSAVRSASKKSSLLHFHLLFLMALTALALIFAPVAARADTNADIKTVIEAQLNAFAADDGAQAYSYAAPIVRQVFPTADMFMAMVKKGYQPVYRNTDRTFGKVTEDSLGRPAMRVVLIGQDGQRYEAIYAMEQQKDGTWKIAGCTIVTIPAQEV
jgi:hypothetical protein